MTKQVAITGSEGTIGTVVKDELKDRYELSFLDRNPDVGNRENGYTMDLAEEYDRLVEVLGGHDAVIHLAWNLEENFNTGEARIKNREMFENVYRAARETDVKKVLIASSIHAIDMNGTFAEEPYRSIARGLKDRSELADHEKVGIDGKKPSSLYGWCKLLMEHRGEKYAGDETFVTCIRFGGIHPENEADYPGAHKPVNYYPSVYCSYNDCGRLLRHIIELAPETVDSNFHLVYGISDNTRRVHELDNSLGWMPEDDSEDRLDEYWDPMESEQTE